MLIVTETPANYRPDNKLDSGGRDLWPWCIIDPDDGDVYEFYQSKEKAEDAYRDAFKKAPLYWADWVAYQNKINGVLEERDQRIDFLVAFCNFLEDHGYLDSDWRVEHPLAVYKFLKEYKPNEKKA